MKDAGGRQPEALLHRSQNVPRQDWPLDWSSKGIVYASGSDAESDDLWMLPLDGDKKPYSLVSDRGRQDEARVSPNARWLAYTDLAKGRPEVFVQSLVTGVKHGISTAGGASPRWRSDRKELFYLAADWEPMAVPIHADGATFPIRCGESVVSTELSIVGEERGCSMCRLTASVFSSRSPAIRTKPPQSSS